MFSLKHLVKTEIIKKFNRNGNLIALSAPQGAGKTTLTSQLVNELHAQNIPAISLSIDDFYLTHEDQLKLARTHPNNPYLQQRGCPGTHDLTLAHEVLSQLKSPFKEPSNNPPSDNTIPPLLPRYDKSAFSGEGDRFPKNQWTQLTTWPQVIFLEGWFLGFESLTASNEDPNSSNNPAASNQALAPFSSHPHPEALMECDRLLSPYKALERYFDAFIHLYVDNTDYVINWRVEAEENMKAQGKPGMSSEAIYSYIKKFIPAYDIYVPELLKRKWTIPHLCKKIGAHRDIEP